MRHKILIIEDEKPAANRVIKMIHKLDNAVEIVAVIDSIEDTVNWFKNYDPPQLIFMDIQLADGNSFSIFEKINVETPVIFTTAYDEFAVKAFKVNSIDYLLKPIDEESLSTAWQKYLRLNELGKGFDYTLIQKVFNQKQEVSYKERFLIKTGENFTYCNVNDVAYILSEEGYSFIITLKNKKYIIDDKLEELEKLLNPKLFFKINRKFIIKIDSIDKISNYFNSRLKLTLRPKAEKEVIVAREKVGKFKTWLNQ